MRSVALEDFCVERVDGYFVFIGSGSMYAADHPRTVQATRQIHQHRPLFEARLLPADERFDSLKSFFIFMFGFFFVMKCHQVLQIFQRYQMEALVPK